MVELVQSAWGDWWIVARGTAVVVHLRNRSDVETEARARTHASRLFPGVPFATRPFQSGAAVPQLDRHEGDERSAVDDLVADKPHTLGRDARRPAA